MEEVLKIAKDIRRMEQAIKKSNSRYLTRDYVKCIKRKKKELAIKCKSLNHRELQEIAKRLEGEIYGMDR